MYRLDHGVSRIELEGTFEGRSTPATRWGGSRANLALLAQPDNIEEAREFLRTQAPTPWHTDVHTHCDRFTQIANATADILSDPKAKTPREEWISPETFTQLRIKGLLFDLGKSARRGSTLMALSNTFSLWKSRTLDPVSGFRRTDGFKRREEDRERSAIALLREVSLSVRSRLDPFFS